MRIYEVYLHLLLNYCLKINTKIIRWNTLIKEWKFVYTKLLYTFREEYCWSTATRVMITIYLCPQPFKVIARNKSFAVNASTFLIGIEPIRPGCQWWTRSPPARSHRLTTCWLAPIMRKWLASRVTFARDMLTCVCEFLDRSLDIEVSLVPLIMFRLNINAEVYDIRVIVCNSSWTSEHNVRVHHRTALAASANAFIQYRWPGTIIIISASSANNSFLFIFKSALSVQKGKHRSASETRGSRPAASASALVASPGDW